MTYVNEELPVLFVVGTDTDVGKTVLSLLLMQFFFRHGRCPFYLKPVQTGCSDPYDVDSDARFIYRHVEAMQHKDPAESVLYCFRNPKAPLMAARDEGKTIDVKRIENVVAERKRSSDPVIVEAAGGVLVPVTEEILVADLVYRLDASPIIAARAGLGTINHTLLTVEALEKRGVRPLGIVLIDAGEKETEAEMIRENMEAIERISGVAVSGVIRRFGDFSHPPEESDQPLIKLFSKEV